MARGDSRAPLAGEGHEDSASADEAQAAHAASAACTLAVSATQQGSVVLAAGSVVMAAETMKAGVPSPAFKVRVQNLVAAQVAGGSRLQESGRPEAPAGPSEVRVLRLPGRACRKGPPAVR